MNNKQIKLNKNKKRSIVLLIFSIVLLSILPNLIISNQREGETSNDEKWQDDMSIPQTPSTSTIYYSNISGFANGVYVSGDYAYLANHNYGLAIINISDPTNPGAPINVDINGIVYGVIVNGSYAYLAIGEAGLAIINISDPTNPGTPIYRSSGGGFQAHAFDLHISGNYVYLADNYEGLAIIDITDPTSPGSPINIDTIGSARAVYVSGDYAYVADENYGLAIINISDPTNPGAPVYVNAPGIVSDVFVSGYYAYLAGSTGLTIINVSDPTNPGTPINISTIGGPMGVYVSEDYAYLAEGFFGLGVMDISDPTNPGIPVYETSDDPEQMFSKVFVKGDYAYIADKMRGDFAIIHVREMIGPIITNTPSDLIVDFGYTGQSVSWTATDRDPESYTIELLGTGIVTGPTAWSNGTEITFNIPDGLLPVDSTFKITFTDIYDNTVSDSVTMTVRDTMDPIITNTPPDFTIVVGYSEASISWTVTDHTPDTYTIALEGTGIVASPTAWSNATEITYNVPVGLALGEHNYTANFTDDFDNFITDTVTMTVVVKSDAIPYGNFYLIFFFTAIISVVIIQTQKKKFRRN